MPSAATNPWKLESFLDSLILELDKAQDTLAIKGVTRKLTYTVRDLGVDLYVFPNFDGGALRFNVARPGESGASKISFQLGSITDRQIREDGNELLSSDDITIDDVKELEPAVKDSLKRLGVKSARDIDKLNQRSVDVGSAVEDKTGGGAKLNYDNLAQIINKARRQKSAPRVMGLSAERDGDSINLAVAGDNLAIDGAPAGYPLAYVNGHSADVVDSGPSHLKIRVPAGNMRPGSNSLSMALDPYALVSLNIDGGRGGNA